MAGSGGLTDFGHLLILACAYSVFKAFLSAIKQAVQYPDLFFAQRGIAVLLPEAGFLYGAVDRPDGAVDGGFECLQEPAQPGGDIQRLCRVVFLFSVICCIF